MQQEKLKSKTKTKKKRAAGASKKPLQQSKISDFKDQGFFRLKKRPDGVLVPVNSPPTTAPAAHTCPFCHQEFERGTAFANHLKTHKGETDPGQPPLNLVKDRGPAQPAEAVAAAPAVAVAAAGADAAAIADVVVMETDADSVEGAKRAAHHADGDKEKESKGDGKDDKKAEKKAEQNGKEEKKAEPNIAKASGPVEKKSRKRYSFAAKARWVRRYDEVAADAAKNHKDVKFPLSLVASEVGVSAGTLSDWVGKERSKIMTAAADPKMRKLLAWPAPRVRFPQLEAELMRRFKERRKHGRKVTERWLVVSARQLAKKLYPKAEFHASHGWRVRFANRAGIAPRRKTNTKQHSVFERLPLVRRFLLDLRAMLRENRVDTASQHTPKWGRFPPHLRGNFDEVPLSFCMEMNTTFEEIGASGVHIKEPGSGALSKRQATLVLFAIPGAKKQPRAALIFKGTGKGISQAERDAWDQRVDVYFQRNAWSDTPFAVEYANRTIKAAVPGHGKERFLLFSDNLKSHCSAEFKAACAAHNVLLWYYPKNTTDITQPVDAGLGRDVKREMARLQDEWLADDKNLKRWESNKLTASDRRILMTVWVRCKRFGVLRLTSYSYAPGLLFRRRRRSRRSSRTWRP